MADSQPPQAWAPGPVLFGKYVLERRLAVGGTSEVYLARPRSSTDPAERLVIKRLLPADRSNPAAAEHFAAEARLLRSVRHPNLVEVLEAGEVAGEPYLAMAYVEGIDAFRLLRRAQAEDRPIPELLGIHIARCLCAALDGLHNARDAEGKPLSILHRDVTPSNIYLSTAGEVLLGDFGLARVQHRSSRPGVVAAINGKYGYLAPEQFSNEPVDQRADLFSCAVVASELILGRPLFAGAGQLAVLLAIRDVQIDALRAAAGRMSLGLFGVLHQALSRDPADRFPSARALGEALAPYEVPSREAARELLREWVVWARDTGTITRRLRGAIQGSEERLRDLDEDTVDQAPADLDFLLDEPGALDPAVPPSTMFEEWDEELVTSRIDEKPSRVRAFGLTSDTILPFARIIEMIATGELGPEDEVDLLGQGFRPVAEIELLERHLPEPGITSNLEAPSAPDETADLGQAQLLPLVGRLVLARETGLLLLEGRGAGDELPLRREVYFTEGKLLHVGTSEPSEMLGQSLVRKGVISSSELDMALAVLSRFDGNLGDTLIGLGLMEGVEMVQAIEAQGRERFARLFTWTRGSALFFRGVQPSRVEFPLSLDVPPLLLNAMEVAYPHDTPLIQSRAILARVLRPTAAVLQPGASRGLPETLVRLIQAAGRQGLELRKVLLALSTSRQIGAPDALRAMYVGVALGLCEIV
jgi:serine/threonine-protein kinase